MNYAQVAVIAYFNLFANLCHCFNTKINENIPNIYLMAILIRAAACHVGNAFKRLPRPNAPTAKVVTSVIFKVIE